MPPDFEGGHLSPQALWRGRGKALESELLRVRLNEDEIGELIAEYATRRGLFPHQSEFSWAEAGCPAIASALASWEDGTGRERAARDAAAAAAGRSKEAEAVSTAPSQGVARSPRLAFEIKRRELLGLMRGKAAAAGGVDIARGTQDPVDRDPGRWRPERPWPRWCSANKGRGMTMGRGRLRCRPSQRRSVAPRGSIRFRGPPRAQAKLLEADEIWASTSLSGWCPPRRLLWSKEAVEMDEGEPPGK